jgi:4-azaleucine resistance transporter AzlC
VSDARASFWAGVRAELPILLGVIPFGMIYGVAATGAGLSDWQAQAMSSIVFAGSAQFIMAQLFGQHTPALIIVLTALLVNLRHVLYSASVAPYLQHVPGRWKGALAYLLTDEAYAVAIVHLQYARPHPARHWYFLGAGLALWTTWQLSTAGGILLGAAIPASWGLDFALALTFIALVVPALRDWPSVAAALIAGVTAVLGHNWPLQLGLLAAAAAGIGAGLAMAAWREAPPAVAGPE